MSSQETPTKKSKPNKEQNNKQNTKLNIIAIGDLCYESFPCQHDCTILNADGTTTSGLLSAPTIVENANELIQKTDWMADHFLGIS